nr:MAG TPA: hypothetical protein [Caudoviricetes sp.]
MLQLPKYSSYDLFIRYSILRDAQIYILFFHYSIILLLFVCLKPHKITK